MLQVSWFRCFFALSIHHSPVMKSMNKEPLVKIVKPNQSRNTVSHLFLLLWFSLSLSLLMCCFIFLNQTYFANQVMTNYLAVLSFSLNQMSIFHFVCTYISILQCGFFVACIYLTGSIFTVLRLMFCCGFCCCWVCFVVFFVFLCVSFYCLLTSMYMSLKMHFKDCHSKLSLGVYVYIKQWM